MLGMLALIACARGADVDRAVLLTPASMPRDGASLPTTFKVVAFNVHRRPGEAIVNAVQRDPALRDADLIVLSEVPAKGACGAACVAARTLGRYAAFEPDYELRGAQIGQAVLSRVPILSARLIVLPTFGVHQNAALVAVVRVGGVPVTLYSVHLTDEISFPERIRQMRPILADARARITPVIIAGDFNTPINYEQHMLPVAEGHATDRFEAFVRAYGFTTPVSRSGSTWRVLPLKLDAIYTRDFETWRFGTSHGDDISDHLALWAVMTLQPASRSIATREP